MRSPTWTTHVVLGLVGQADAHVLDDLGEGGALAGVVVDLVGAGATGAKVTYTRVIPAEKNITENDLAVMRGIFSVADDESGTLERVVPWPGLSLILLVPVSARVVRTSVPSLT